jgi:Mor family transcriptional regulator
MAAPLPRYEFLEDAYFPFRLYSEFSRGESIEALARKYSIAALWIQERIEAARLCIEKQVRIEGALQHARR